MEVWYCDIKNISESDFQRLLQECSPNEREEILRYRYLKDRLFRLIGHRMVMLKYNTTYEDYIRTEGGKPYLRSGGKFNISHAGTTVAAAFSPFEVGIDIEALSEMDTEGMSSFFHSEEQTQLAELEGDNRLRLFYRIWTRKEAFLKAIGQGIVNGLNGFNCLQDQVSFKGEIWKIKSLDEIDEYALTVCSPSDLDSVDFKEIFYEDLSLSSNPYI